MNTRYAVVPAAVLLLAACGGGGGSSAIAPEPALPPESLTPQVTVTDLPDAERVANYLGIHASGHMPHQAYFHVPGLHRFKSAPTVRPVAGMTDAERAITHYGVALVNRALPYDHHVRIGDDGASVITDDNDARWNDVGDGEIYVEWHRRSADGHLWPTVARQDNVITWDPERERWQKSGGIRAATVDMDADYFKDWRSRHRHEADPNHELQVFLHEFLHSLGLQMHVTGLDRAGFAGSLMSDVWLPERAFSGGELPAVDAAALLALYTRLPVSIQPEELSANDLGEWDDTATGLTVRTGSVTFGVRHANGVTMPWTSGAHRPEDELADDRQLGGSGTWTGHLVAFTPGLETVEGDVEVRVSLATMQGRADFTELETRDGANWGDGDLSYTIAVGANYLRSTGGDAGTVSGRFYGSAHEVVAGAVERADLTAAFAAVRQ